MDIVTQAANSYTHIFSGYVSQFLQWGKWLFFSLLTINVVWLSLWYAFDRHALAETLPAFLKKFFVISFFYTVMIHPRWLSSLLSTSQAMGNRLVHAPIDPSSLITQGIGLVNTIMAPASHSGLFSMVFTGFLLCVVYVVVLFVFISIALDLALTLIMTTALISVATFLLGFAALGATQQIARQTLDVILANCVKLLGIYCVVAAGSQTISKVALAIPKQIGNFEPYVWIVAVVLFFWLLAKNLPNQLAKIVSGAIMETEGPSATALMMAANNLSSVAMNLGKLANNLLQGVGKLAGSTAYSTLQQAKKAAMQTVSGHPIKGLGTLMGGPIKQVGQAVGGYASDHLKNASRQLIGGPATKQPIQSVSSRLYQAAKATMAAKNAPPPAS